MQGKMLTGGGRAGGPGQAVGGHVIKRLAPGSAGTRRLLERYGAALVCVRYREDPARGRRYTTVELVVDQREFTIQEERVRVAFGETELRKRVKEAGGRWDAKRKLWLLSRPAIRALGLQKRVVRIDD